MKRWFGGLVAALAATAMVGCVGNLTDSDVGHMSGALGEVSFDGAPEVREVEINRRDLVVDLRVHNQNGTAMIQITIPHEGLDGDEMVYHPEEARMLGCSGEDDGEWDFDCEPQEFFVDVYDGKDELGLEFEGTWTEDDCRDVPDDAPDGEQPADGYVEVDLI